MILAHGIYAAASGIHPIQGCKKKHIVDALDIASKPAATLGTYRVSLVPYLHNARIEGAPTLSRNP